MRRALVGVVVVVSACGDDGTTMPGDGSGSGSNTGEGISAEYPNDEGIGADPRVLFADDFESYTAVAQLDTRWDARFHEVALTKTAANVYAGAQAVEMTAPVQTQELSTAIAKVLDNTVDTLYLRYYSKYEGTFGIIGSSHNGSDISAGYYVNGNATPGVPANGTNKYLIAFENWRGDAATTTPGEQNIYIYHPAQRDNYGDHFFPDGRVMPNTSIPGDFGTEFVARPNFTPELDRWYSYEVMLHANTPGERDGRITCWVDGEVIADFTNLRLRDVATLKIDRFGLNLHFHDNAVETRKWYDNVVAATAYIGPMVRR